ncbi:MAG: hypothetical protein KAI55_01795 [Candidatus Aenigmarchaeota archaeon]|nr:hypothetical protein [Candidatus Aenigmarchaeota archaeon]
MKITRGMAYNKKGRNLYISYPPIKKSAPFIIKKIKIGIKDDIENKIFCFFETPIFFINSIGNRIIGKIKPPPNMTNMINNKMLSEIIIYLLDTLIFIYFSINYYMAFRPPLF